MTLIEHYRILGLASNAGIQELKKAFREKAKIFHPDLNPSPDAREKFILVHAAYTIVLEYMEGKARRVAIDPADLREQRRKQADDRARHYARMKYEEFVKECEAYKQSPYKWFFKMLYYGLFYLYMLCAMVFAMVPLWAGWEGGIFYFLICLPLFVLAYFTVGMANDWKKEIDPLFY
jgi:hypothetical protein